LQETDPQSVATLYEQDDHHFMQMLTKRMLQRRKPKKDIVLPSKCTSSISL